MVTKTRAEMLKEQMKEPSIFDSHYLPGSKACIERSRYMTESFKQTEGEPMVIRRANALANFLEKRTIFITKGELITGNVGRAPGYIPFFCEIMSAERIRDDIVKPGMLTDDEWKELDEILAYWKGKTLEEVCLRAFPEEVKREVYPPEDWRITDAPCYHSGITAICPDLEMLLSLGLNGIKKKIKARLAELDILKTPPPQVERALKQIDTLNAMLIAAEAAIKLAKRYSQLAKETAKKETDPTRKAELEQIAENCTRVPAEPAETFWQALQSIWFQQMINRVLEGPGVGIGQRFDQLLLPYYRKDMESSRLTKEKAQELLENFWIKTEREIVHIRPGVERERAKGQSLWQNIAIGGVDGNGNDATNELSYLILEISKSVKTVQPTLSLRYNPRTPDDLIAKAFEVIKTGLGMPAFFNDEPMIAHMLTMGFSLNDARNYGMVCCLDYVVPGRNQISKVLGIADMNVAKCLEIALNDGVDMLDGKQVGPKTGDPRKFKTFDDVLEAFAKQVNYALMIGMYDNNIYRIKQAELLHRPFGSLLFESAIEQAEDITQYEDHETPWCVVSGAIDAADSLAAIKKLVFDDKKVTWDELLKALKANFKGYENIWQLCHETPKWGHDDDYVDSVTRETFDVINRECDKFTGIHGAHLRGMYQSFGVFVTAGMKTAALPCGRKAGQPLADGGVSPEAGFGTDPTKVIKSISKLDLVMPEHLLLNQRLSPGTTPRQFVNFIRAWGDLGLRHTQFNVFDVETLRDAQAKPEKYPELVVRVAGYSAHFVYLSRETQDAIIARSEQSFAA